MKSFNHPSAITNALSQTFGPLLWVWTKIKTPTVTHVLMQKQKQKNKQIKCLTLKKGKNEWPSSN